MAKAPKPLIQSFLADWNARQTWAVNNHIPYNDFMATVKYAYDKMITTGYPMGDAEAFDLLTAVASGKQPFTTPTSQPPNVTQGVSGIYGAMENDVSGIFSGLFHMPQSLYHDAIGAIEGHPSGLFNLIPGYMDIKNMLSSSGRLWMEQHPISDLIDLGGLGSSEVAGAVADSADLSEVAGLADHVATPSTVVVHGIGGALYKLGAQDLARFVAKIPDHPITTMVKALSNTLGQHFELVQHMQTWGADIGDKAIGRLSMFKYQQERMLRPLSMLQEVTKAVPDPRCRSVCEYQARASTTREKYTRSGLWQEQPS